MSGRGDVDLIEFLLARLDEDEAVARAAIQGPWRIGSEEGPSHWLGSGGVAQPLPEHCQHILYGQSPIRRDGRVQVADLSMAWERAENARHIARWDPTRVLAEVEAKRFVIDVLQGAEPHDEWETQPDIGQRANNAAGALRRMAWPYRDHPDYNPEWIPSGFPGSLHTSTRDG